MKSCGVTESVVDQAALAWFESLGYQVLHGPDIGRGERDAERQGYDDLVLANHLQATLQRNNPDLPADTPSARSPG